MKRLWRSRKALSPVVAAIILIAVTVAVSIAVAAWMGALTFTFMGYEKLEMTACDWTWGASGSRTIMVTVANTGTKDITVNHVEVNYVGVATVDVSPETPFTFATTDSAKDITITYDYVNGSSYDISVVTSSGHEFTDHFTGGQDET
jgi:flagellin-like protein